MLHMQKLAEDLDRFANGQECLRCHITKPLDDFPRHNRRVDGRPDPWCWDCVREVHRLKIYNLTPKEHKALLRKQGGGCAICLKPETKKHPLHVDHDHATGEVRGLLCQDCNTGIGLLKDNIEALRRAIAYLEGN